MLQLADTAATCGRVSQRATKRTRGYSHSLSSSNRKIGLSNPTGHCWMRTSYFLVPVSLFQACAVPTSCQMLLGTSTLPEFTLFYLFHSSLFYPQRSFASWDMTPNGVRYLLQLLLWDVTCMDYSLLLIFATTPCSTANKAVETKTLKYIYLSGCFISKSVVFEFVILLNVKVLIKNTYIKIFFQICHN